MHMFTERTQVLLSKPQAERLRRRARQERKSVGAVVREAVDAYTATPDDDERQAALERLFALEAPVDEWPVMKEQILRSQLGEEA
jgi:hypothetical protein